MHRCAFPENQSDLELEHLFHYAIATVGPLRVACQATVGPLRAACQATLRPIRAACQATVGPLRAAHQSPLSASLTLGGPSDESSVSISWKNGDQMSFLALHYIDWLTIERALIQLVLGDISTSISISRYLPNIEYRNDLFPKYRISRYVRPYRRVFMLGLILELFNKYQMARV